MSFPAPDTVRLREHGELIAAVPHLLGFHPVDSLVAIGVEGNRIGLTLRCDLVPDRDAEALAAQLAQPLARQRPSGVVLMVIGGGEGTDGGLPGAAVVSAVADALERLGVPIRHAAWARSTRRDAPWRCFDEVGCGGRIPDPDASAVGAATVAAGLVTFRDRGELARLLAPDPPEVLARRSVALDRAVRRGTVTRILRRPDRALAGVEKAVRAAGRSRLPDDDATIVRLALALSDRRVRDACLPLCLGERAQPAGSLWLALTRSVPEPERAEPATLLAITCYLRGEGALAGMALEVALLADSEHRLAGLVQVALDAGVPPARLREVAGHAAAEACEQLAEQVPVSARRSG